MSVYFFRSEPGAAELCRLARRESGWLANSVFISLADVMDACEMAWNRFTTNHGLIRSLCAFAWAPASTVLWRHLLEAALVCRNLRRSVLDAKLVYASWKP